MLREILICTVRRPWSSTASCFAVDGSFSIIAITVLIDRSKHNRSFHD